MFLPHGKICETPFLYLQPQSENFEVSESYDFTHFEFQYRFYQFTLSFLFSFSLAELFPFVISNPLNTEWGGGEGGKGDGGGGVHQTQVTFFF